MSKRIMITAILCALSGAGSGCSDIRKDTFEVELTTDKDPHVVELWYHPHERSSELRPAYRLRFPQSYYGYRDNHHYLKQTAIALLLEKPGLAPLTEVVGKAARIEEPLSVWGYKEGALKKQIWGPFKDRKLWVDIRGLYGRPALTRNDMPRVFTNVPVLYHNLDNGFDITRDTRKGAYNKSLPYISGYSSEGRVIRMHCFSDSPNCSFETEHRDSSISFVLPRSETEKSHDIATNLISLIEHHVVKDRE